MPRRRTRSASAAAAAAAPPPVAPAAAPQNSLLGLPDELLHLVADALLHKHLPSALRLLQTCTALRGRLAAVRAAAETRRLRWVAELTNTNGIGISAEGRALTAMIHGGWAAGSLLPTAGRVSFSVRIEESKDNKGIMAIGVCNEANTCGWGLVPFHGMLDRSSRAADGLVNHDEPPPEGWPSADGDYTQVMVNEAGQRDSLKDRARGAVIEIVVDHSDGSLAIGVNGAPPRRVPDAWPSGYDPDEHLEYDDSDDEEGHVAPGHVPPAKVPFKFPQGAQLRPWAFLGEKTDRARFVRGYLSPLNVEPAVPGPG